MINTSMKRIVDYTKVIEKENEQLRKGRKKKEQFLTMTPKDATIIDYTEHSLGKGSEAKAAAYVYMKRNDNNEETFGVGVNSNITLASIKAVFSALNRLYK